MTYCVALKLKEGMVFLSDTRTNAGVDNISKVRKLFTWVNPGDRALALMTAGNLATTQGVVSEINDALGDEAPEALNLFTAGTMFDTAQYVGDTLRSVIERYSPGLSATGQSAGATMLLGGQRKGGKPRLFMIYSAGNFIEATEDTPYFQIGEHKYGKPILDRVVNEDTKLQDGRICALLSMDSTLRSNLTVGMPLDMAVLRSDTLEFEQERRFEENDPDFFKFSEAWSDSLRSAFAYMRTLDV